MFHREGHCFTPHFLKRLQQSTKAPAIKPSPGPACSQQGVAAQQEALPGYCSPTCTLHLVLQSGEGWAEYLLFFLLLLQKNPHRFTGKKTPKSQKSNFNYLIYNYIQPFNCWLQSIFLTMCFKENNYFYFQGTHPITTYFYTCNQFCSLIFIFMLDNQGNIHSICACN